MSKNYGLAVNAALDHEMARDWYNCYGWHISTGRAGDVTLQAVEYDWLDLRDDSGVARILCDSMPRQLSVDEAVQIVEMARSVREAGEVVEELLDEAVEAYGVGDLAAVIDALDRCESFESDFGDSPATQSLRSQLLAEIFADEASADREGGGA